MAYIGVKVGARQVSVEYAGTKLSPGSLLNGAQFEDLQSKTLEAVYCISYPFLDRKAAEPF
jgi:hypothetical protein